MNNNNNNNNNNNTFISVSLNPNDKNGFLAYIDKLQNMTVTAKVICDYCGVSLRTIKRLERNEYKSFTIKVGRKKMYKLGSWILAMSVNYRLTDYEIKKFKGHASERLKRYRFCKSIMHLISEKDAMLKFDLQSSQIQECIEIGLQFIYIRGERIFILSELTGSLYGIGAITIKNERICTIK